MSSEYTISECKCRICGEKGMNKVYKVREMMYGTREEFPYFVCDSCNCMQIMEIPEDLGEYYNNYYSMNMCENIEFSEEVTVQDAILDVGCGSGAYLVELAHKGHGNLFGCDPFIMDDINYGDRIFIKKCEIMGMKGSFDLIRFADSFEHVANPIETLKAVKRLLRRDGKCRIELPVFPNAAWDVFGTDWYEIDAPRHLHLFSRKSVEYMCGLVGLKVEEIVYNSTNAQFFFSYFYSLDIPFIQAFGKNMGEFMTEEEYDYFQEAVEKVNRKEYGDHAYFIITHA